MGEVEEKVRVIQENLRAAQSRQKSYFDKKKETPKIQIQGKIRFMPPQLREFGFHVQNHATQWHGFQHEIQLQEIVVAWIQCGRSCLFAGLSN
jgi:hypothetical protein